MNEKEIFINGLKINYKVVGDGQPFLILHGWGGSSDSWIVVQKLLSNRRYKVIVPDFPGFGKSQDPPRDWKVDDYCNLVLSFIEKLGISNFFLLGHSFGGRVAIKFGAKYPKKLKGLILSDISGIKSEPTINQRLTARIAKIGKLFIKSSFLEEKAKKILYTFLGPADYLKANNVMRETFLNVVKEDLTPLLSQIKILTLIVWGASDRITPIDCAYLIKKEIPNSVLKIIPNAGHSPHLKAPKRLSEIVERFCGDPLSVS